MKFIFVHEKNTKVTQKVSFRRAVNRNKTQLSQKMYWNKYSTFSSTFQHKNNRNCNTSHTVLSIFVGLNLWSPLPGIGDRTWQQPTDCTSSGFLSFGKYWPDRNFFGARKELIRWEQDRSPTSLVIMGILPTVEKCTTPTTHHPVGLWHLVHTPKIFYNEFPLALQSVHSKTLAWTSCRSRRRNENRHLWPL